MALIAVAVAALFASALTLFSGFGLGTLLLPVFALFFPVEIAVTATGLVHAANSFFKLGLLRADVDRKVVVRFGVPAIIAAVAGAMVLARLSGLAPIEVNLLGTPREVSPIAAVMGLLILGFAAMELVPRLHKLRAPPDWLPLGGLLSGFFGGLSGHQGALRAAFLTPLGLSPIAFAATQSAIASMVDLARLSTYAAAIAAGSLIGPSTPDQWAATGVGVVSAFGGALLGRRLLRKVTIEGIRILTGALLLVVGAGLLLGIL